MVVLLQLEQFRTVPVPSLSLLVGINSIASDDDNITHVISGHCNCISHDNDHSKTIISSLSLPSPQWVESWQRIRGCLPGGCDMCGVCVGINNNEFSIEDIVRELLQKTDLQVAMKTQYMVVVVVKSNDVIVYLVTDFTTFQEVGVAPVGDYLSSHTHLLRVTSSLQAIVNLNKPTIADILSSVDVDNQPMFLLSSINYLLPHSLYYNTHTPYHNMRQLVLHHKSLLKEEYISVEMIHTPTNNKHHLTVSFSSNNTSTMAELNIPIDTLVLVNLDLPLIEVGDIIWEAVKCQLHIIATAMLWKHESLYNVAIHHFPSSPFHFTTLSIPYPHTAIISSNTAPLKDSALVSVRKKWHEALGLPLDVPLLRITNIHCFTSPGCHGPQLVCPHTMLSYTPQGTVAMVTGQYAYYHYMQDNFNDTGWGCAYRSLQTLWSWYTLQGFTTLTPPTHTEIQEALVATGDKPGKFIGSKEWIGSFEVSTVLNHLLGVECRIHHVSRGSEMSGVGRVLLHHFTTNNTPVMIGGGVLAHTILGVDYNTSSGDIRFLILDPHYTGTEDVKIIINKGWCGWKSVTFWDNKAHYNMCMPQRPREI